MKSLISVTVLAAFAAVACTSAAAPVTSPTVAEPSAAPGGSPQTPAVQTATRVRLVTLGGSYTFGRYVLRRDTWPNQLVRMLRAVAPVELAANLAQASKTSQDVIDEQIELVKSHRPDIVTLQIGANDVLLNVAMERYRDNVETILDALLAIVPAHRILVVTTPDYTLTERGRTWAHSEQVMEANAIISQAAEGRGVSVVDISPISGRVVQDPSLLAENDLDPSEKQYAGWVELIAPRVRAALAQAGP